MIQQRFKSNERTKNKTGTYHYDLNHRQEMASSMWISGYINSQSLAIIGCVKHVTFKRVTTVFIKLVNIQWGSVVVKPNQLNVNKS
ncbi:hypothetical protein DERP_001800 [Dermatophagoides pteronyssinus]|uniref:Uncharacterized protein n=1 Tax=Dermatophagoides pteronyssinus TaxID=6956 RepID=A0ABQ8JC28_DERPT|nr:hypothetical protein DERP_001800 [Dermatophagoides pteronyssinus]